MAKSTKILPRSMEEAFELGYEYAGGNYFSTGEFLSDKIMEWEGVMEWDLDTSEQDCELHAAQRRVYEDTSLSDEERYKRLREVKLEHGSELGMIQVKVRARFEFEEIQEYKRSDEDNE